MTEGSMLFEIYASGILVGNSALERGAPPMGVGDGKFIAGDSYRQIQDECQGNHADQSGLALSVRTPAGTLAPCIGVAILDYSNDAPKGEKKEWLEVTVMGIPYSLYGELFPEHVARYEEKIGGR
jgi:hypothetical protein